MEVDLEGRRVGVYVNGVYVGSLLFMDDVIGLAGSREHALQLVRATMRCWPGGSSRR